MLSVLSCTRVYYSSALFVFAGAILWKQVSFWRAGETMVGANIVSGRKEYGESWFVVDLEMLKGKRR